MPVPTRSKIATSDIWGQGGFETVANQLGELHIIDIRPYEAHDEIQSKDAE